jgi:ABC-type transport system involved in multi-copper enzyme maturation permease subunit
MNKFLKYIIITVLLLTGLGFIGTLLLAEIPDSVICINPFYESVINFCAYGLMAVCAAGLLSIFVKAIRMPLLVMACVLLLFFLDFACWNSILESVSYKVARGAEPVESPFVIEGKDYTFDSLAIRFLDGETDDTVSAEVPFVVLHRLHEGDTCVAVVWDGLLGVKFVSKIKNVRRKTDNT